MDLSGRPGRRDHRRARPSAAKGEAINMGIQTWKYIRMHEAECSTLLSLGAIHGATQNCGDGSQVGSLRPAILAVRSTAIPADRPLETLH